MKKALSITMALSLALSGGLLSFADTTKVTVEKVSSTVTVIGTEKVTLTNEEVNKILGIDSDDEKEDVQKRDDEDIFGDKGNDDNDVDDDSDKDDDDKKKEKKVKEDKEDKERKEKFNTERENKKKEKELEKQLKELEKSDDKKYQKEIQKLRKEIQGLKKDALEIRKELKKKMRGYYTEQEIKDIQELRAELESTLEEVKALDVDSIISNSAVFKFDLPPVIKSGRTLIPVRAITEGFGAKVQWVGEENKVVITKDDTTIELWINVQEVAVNGEKVVLDTNPEIISSRTFVPLRFIAETLNLTVEWNEEDETIELIDEKVIAVPEETEAETAETQEETTETTTAAE